MHRQSPDKFFIFHRNLNNLSSNSNSKLCTVTSGREKREG